MDDWEHLMFKRKFIKEEHAEYLDSFNKEASKARQAIEATARTKFPQAKLMSVDCVDIGAQYLRDQRGGSITAQHFIRYMDLLEMAYNYIE